MSVCRTANPSVLNRALPGRWRQSKEPNRPRSHNFTQSYATTPRPNADMDIRDPSPGLKDELRHPSTRRRREPGITVAGPGGGRVDSAGSLLRPVPHIIAGGNRDRGGTGTGVDKQQVRSTDLLPQPDQLDFVPARQAENNQGEWADIDGRKVSQRCSHPHSDAGVVVGSGPDQEGNDVDREGVERIHPSLSTPSIPRSGKPDGMWVWLSQLPPLIFRHTLHSRSSSSRRKG